MNDLFAAVRLGMECRKKAREYNARFKNPYFENTDEFVAWRAGYENDLGLWMRVFTAADDAPAVVKKTVRLKAHDRIVFNAHTSSPLSGEFQKYLKDQPGWCQVLLDHSSIRVVPSVSITREARKEVAA